jgi:hypothetical protein
MMALGEDGQFKREAAGEGAEENVAVVFRDQPRAVGAFGVEDVAEEAALLEKIMVAGADQLAFDKGGTSGSATSCEWAWASDAPALGPDILEDVDVLEALVLVEVDDPFAVAGEDLGDGGTAGLPGRDRRRAFR